jgi:hypothetical protein
MATKKAKNGKSLEYIIIRPTFGFDVSTLANAILWYHQDVEKFKSTHKTWNKIMEAAKSGILEEGLQKLEYVFEAIDDYDAKHKSLVEYMKSINPQID